jgi:hypothetical protein
VCTGAEGQNLKHDVTRSCHVQQVSKLSLQDASTADLLPESILTNDCPQLQGIWSADYLLPLHTDGCKTINVW